MDSDLEDLIKKAYRNLPKSEQKVAEYILKSPEEVAFLPCRTVAQRVGVSDATVVRMSHRLVADGYGGLKKRLQASLKEKITPSQKLESTNIGEDESIYHAVFRSNLENIGRAEESLGAEKFDEVVNRLDNARKIFLVGERRSHTFAFHFFYNLSRIMNNVFLVRNMHGLQFDEMRDIGHKDVMVGISFRRYSRGTFEVVKFAKHKKCYVIAFTDSPISPIGQIANLTVQVDFGSPFFYGSYASTLVIIDAFIGGLSLKHKKRGVLAMKKFEKTLKNWGVWLE